MSNVFPSSKKGWSPRATPATMTRMPEGYAEEFLIGWCTVCKQQVLTYGAEEAGGAELHLCVRCSEPVCDELRMASREEIEEQGFAIFDEAGCGRPDCGNGRCGRG